jgi:putative membrane protein
MWWNDYWLMPWMPFVPMVGIAFLAICMAMMFFMMRGGMRHPNHRNDAIDILKERFARGEITQTEYEDRRRLLEV